MSFGVENWNVGNTDRLKSFEKVLTNACKQLKKMC